MKTKLPSLFVALVATTALWASNFITYTATEKLPETEDGVVGLHTNAFNVAIISHEFSNGTGTISFAGEVTTIGEFAFSRCSDLTSITIPNSVTTIGYAAFADCYDLTTITIPNSVTTIGEHAFTWCKGLTSVTIGNSVTTIGKDAFYYCPKLTSITIPKSVTTIEEYAFGSCESLFDVYVSWTQKSQLPTLGEGVFDFIAYDETSYSDGPQNATLHIPAGTKNMYETADGWKDFGKIESVELGEIFEIDGINYIITSNATVAVTTKIPQYSGHIVIPASVTINSRTYSVTELGDKAFSGCMDITSITCYATVPPLCGAQCFSLVDKSIPVYVPKESVAAYKQAEKWKEFTNIQGMESDLNTINAIKSNRYKVFKDGKLMIIRDNVPYNFQGMRL